MSATDAAKAAREFYTGAVDAVAQSIIIGPLPWRPEAERVLNSGRSTATIIRRSSAVWAASSIRDATAIAAIRAPDARTPYTAIHVYRVELVPAHIGPLAVIDVLQERLEKRARAPIEPLIREYWRPTRAWHLQEILAESLKILEEVPAYFKPDIYLPRWVLYNLDRGRAEAL